MEGADIDAMNIAVNNMKNMLNLFSVAGDGSTVMVGSLVAEGNDLSAVNPPTRWTAVNIGENATGTVTSASFSDNTNVRHIFSASSSSSLNILGASVASTTGGRVVVSALYAVFAGLS